MAFVDLNDALISQVRQSADIVEFVSQVTPLKMAGKSYKGLCPFHREKTPSFHVNREKGFFYCFGCQTGGDIFKFLTLTERLTFPEAVEHVASRVGIALPSRRTKRESGKDDLLEIVEEAANAFHQALGWLPNLAESYLQQRGIDPEIWNKYGFGYAPDSWDYLLTRLGGKYSPQRIEAAGLALPRKSGSGFYDRFRNRLMIPIHSEGGTLIGFGGRSLDGNDPKYLNSPESELFNKSALLYNVQRAKDKIRKTERAILVEGYFDAIALDHAGVPGVVASMGTSLTAGQASLLRRLARRVLICYDGDSAGRSAALRGAPILLSAGLEVAIVDVGAGHDPDTLIRERGIDGFLEKLAVATDVFAFALSEWVASPAEMTSREKGEALEAFVPLLTATSDPIARNDAAQRIADTLRLEFETVWSRVRGRQRVPGERMTMAPVSTGEKEILKAILEGECPPKLFSRLRPALFEDLPCKTIFEVVSEAISAGRELDFSAIATHLKGDAELTRVSELALGDPAGERDPKALEETVRLMERRFLDHRLKEIQLQLQEAIREGDHEREHSLLLEKGELSKRLHALK
ncbi:MAG TPA: DNA primase [Thermoanaerobaculia bacterium]|nr:DNA primase [Thermoanaerobaculia bacterium]